MNVLDLVERYDFKSLSKLLSSNNNFNNTNPNDKDYINIEVVNSYGNTPLLQACYYGYSKIVQILVENNCNIKAINYFGQNALTLATYANSNVVIDYLLEKRSYKDFVLSSMVPPLSTAIIFGHKELIKKFSNMNQQLPPSLMNTVHGLTVDDLIFFKKHEN